MHVSQTTRQEYSENDPDALVVTQTSTCVSFTFYTPSSPSPYANLDVHANADSLRSSSPISIGSTDDDNEGFTPIVNDMPSAIMSAVDDPCADIRSTDVSATGQSPTVAANAASPTVPASAAPTTTTSATHPTTASETPAQQPAIGLGDAPISCPPIAPPSTPTEGSRTLPVHSDERWYCVTVGRQVGVFNGPYVLVLLHYDFVYIYSSPLVSENVIGLVTGVSGACYPRHSSEASARAAFASALARNQVQVKI